MEAVRIELRKLARGYARAVGGVRAARLHLLVLVAAILLAFAHRAVIALPLFDHLAGRWIPALIAGVALYFLGPLLRSGAALFARPREDLLARRLDDRHGWQDATETALTLAPAEIERPVSQLLLAQTEGRLREVDARRLAKAPRPRRWPRRILAFLFVAVLLLPGIDGLFRGGGGGTTGGDLGSRGPEDAVGAPHAMKADFWLQTFVQNPLAVEPLPGPDGEQAAKDAKQAKGAKDENARDETTKMGGDK